MFSFFKKKTPKTKMQQLIAESGYEQAVKIAADSIIQRLPNKSLALIYILQEMDGASLGNDYSKLVAANSGIPSEAYKGTLEEEHPGIKEAFDHITNYSLQLHEDQSLMARFRCDVDTAIMKHFEFGRFSKYDPKKNKGFDFIDFDGDSDEDLKSRKNYEILSNGFCIKDKDSGDELNVTIRSGMFHGEVVIGRTGMRAGLAPWPVNTNPFQDDGHFYGSGRSPQGSWEFSVRPSSPFNQIIKEARERYARRAGSDT